MYENYYFNDINNSKSRDYIIGMCRNSLSICIGSSTLLMTVKTVLYPLRISTMLAARD